MAKMYLWAIFGLAAVLSALAQGPGSACRFSYVGLRACHQHAGVDFRAPRYDLTRLYQFCRTEDATVVSHCLRTLFANCSFPEDLTRTLGSVATKVELGFRILCGDIDALLDARECINGVMGSIMGCFETVNREYDERYREQNSQLHTVVDRMRFDLSPERQCPMANSMAVCIYRVVRPCGLNAATALYNFELADNGGTCPW